MGGNIERTVSTLLATTLSTRAQVDPKNAVLFLWVSSTSYLTKFCLHMYVSAWVVTAIERLRTKDGMRIGSAMVPFFVACGFFMLKTSTPSIFPNNWSRSRPVACCSSVGTAPGADPGP